MEHRHIIKNISNFIEIIQESIKEFDQHFKDSQTVFRGQSDSQYDLVSSLFREKRYSNFEYNLIHFLRSSKFVEEEDELEIAIRAQHYGYHTRLLDVTYNSLIALYFACQDNNDKDGAVFIINVDRFLPPTSIELSDLYKRLIKNYDILEELSVGNRSPLIIETIKNNDRIIAQSGAFLIFYNSNHKLDYVNRVIKLEIPKKLKQTILNQLDKSFKITKGSVFPDIESNSDDFNNTIGNINYKGINCSDIFETLTFENLENYVNEKSIIFNSAVFDSSIERENHLSKIKEHLNKLIKFYFRNRSDSEHDCLLEKYLGKFESLQNERQ